MVSRDKIEPQWVLVEEHLCNVSDFAHLVPRQRPPAVCPLCQLPVVLKLGTIKIHHYAHAREGSCAASLPETALHLNTKFHFYRQLQEAEERHLFIDQECERCHQEMRRHVWVQNWDEVKVEYRMNGARPDIALLVRGRVVGALEILVSHAVDERKAAYFGQQEIAWLEIPASTPLYEEPTAWRVTAPLPIRPHTMPYPPWMCSACVLREEQERPARERAQRQQQQREQYLSEIVIHAAMMADIYFTGGKKYREVFYVKKRVRDGQCLKVWVENDKRKTLKAIPVTEVQPLRLALQDLKDWVTQYIETFRRQGHIVDEVAKWRLWEPGRKFVARDFDRYPLQFSWKECIRQWVPHQQRESTHSAISGDTMERRRASLPAVLHLTNLREHPRVRQQSVTILAELPQSEVTPHLRAFLQDDDEGVRLAAALALAQWNDRAAVPVLMDFAANPAFEYRHTALTALAPFQDETRISSLLEAALSDEDPRVRMAATHALGTVVPNSGTD